MPRRVIVSGAVLTLLLLTLSSLATPWSRPAAAANWHGLVLYFPQTGHHLGGDFLWAWLANGGLMTFGFPITEPFTQDGMVVQYFERARFEYHPQNHGTRYVVLASLLGRWITEGRQFEAAFRPVQLDPSIGNDDPQRRYFPETGHTLAYGFKAYWEANGGLYTFGYPISEEFTEWNPDTGQYYTVQYFERARFEYHPENAGTPFEVLLGRLGVQYAQARGLDTSPVPKRPDAIEVPSQLLDYRWSRAVATDDGAVFGRVTATTLAIRSGPRNDAPIVAWTYARHPVPLRGLTLGEPVGGNPVWYEIGAGRYVAAAWVEPLVPDVPPRRFGGRWVDVSLRSFYAVAYDGDRPVYAAIITAGRDGKTPVGVFQIFSRVRNETMDAATVGIPPGSPGYYYLTNVQFTQYFRSGGYALHGNYWTPPSQFGGFTSNGCVGLLNSDAEWFWNFLTIGSVVSIHY
ncbi:MAG: L,D-transpeptidase family protein [Thermomicrobium sp.]|nr:L,D-transpeptidase family protein [Thermomicrobium sp.]